MARTWIRWLPAAAVPAVVAGTLAVTSQAGAADLPDKSPEDVLALLAGTSVESFSGAFALTSDLGLPGLPTSVHGGVDGGAAAGIGAALSWLTGDHTGRVYVDGPDHARVQLMDSFTELNLVRDGDDLWLHDFEQGAVTHLAVPDHRRGMPHEGTAHHEGWLRGARTPTGDLAGLMSPDELAGRVLEAVTPTADLAVDDDVTVAGRDAYALVLMPRAAQTLVASVTISVDGETGFPLGVTVHAHGQDEPALDLAYTSLDLTAPDPSVFDFTPPPGATVTEPATPGTVPCPDEGAARHARTGAEAGDAGVETVGTGWESVLVLPADAALLTDPLLETLTEQVDGGRVLATALLTALVTDDGRLLVGAVPVERLQAVAAGS